MGAALPTDEAGTSSTLAALGAAPSEARLRLLTPPRFCAGWARVSAGAASTACRQAACARRSGLRTGATGGGEVDGTWAPSSSPGPAIRSADRLAAGRAKGSRAARLMVAAARSLWAETSGRLAWSRSRLSSAPTWPSAVASCCRKVARAPTREFSCSRSKSKSSVEACAAKGSVACPTMNAMHAPNTAARRLGRGARPQEPISIVPPVIDYARRHSEDASAIILPGMGQPSQGHRCGRTAAGSARAAMAGCRLRNRHRR